MHRPTRHTQGGWAPALTRRPPPITEHRAAAIAELCHLIVASVSLNGVCWLEDFWKWLAEALTSHQVTLRVR